MEFHNEMLPVALVYPLHEQAMTKLKSACPELRGHLIVQDRLEVIECFSKDRASGIVKMEHDFFEDQPVQGIKHCFYLQSKVLMLVQERRYTTFVGFST